jgi:septum formation protein
LLHVPDANIQWLQHIQIGLKNLEIIPSPLPENLPKSLSPFEYVLQTATQKATHVYSSQIDNTELGEPALVLAADTIVVSHLGHVLEKPRSEADHIAMLKMLRTSGYHRVYTAVIAMTPLASARDPGYAMESTVEETTVRFGKDIDDDMLLAYVRTREGADKAGGYGIQGIGAILVDRIEGSWDNVVGLPLRATLGLIEKALRQGDEEEMGDEFAEAEGDE